MKLIHCDWKLKLALKVRSISAIDDLILNEMYYFKLSSDYVINYNAM